MSATAIRPWLVGLLCLIAVHLVASQTGQINLCSGNSMGRYSLSALITSQSDIVGYPKSFGIWGLQQTHYNKSLINFCAAPDSCPGYYGCIFTNDTSPTVGVCPITGTVKGIIGNFVDPAFPSLGATFECSTNATYGASLVGLVSSAGRAQNSHTHLALSSATAHQPAASALSLCASSCGPDAGPNTATPGGTVAGFDSLDTSPKVGANPSSFVFGVPASAFCL